MPLTIDKSKENCHTYGGPSSNGDTTEEEIVEMMLRSVHTIKGKLLELQDKIEKACSSS